MFELLRDFRFAVRALFKARAFTVAVVCILALGIVFETSVIAVLNAYLVRTLPFPGAARLYNVVYSAPGQRDPEDMEDLDWRSLSDLIEHPIAWDLDVFYLIGGDHPESSPGAWVTPDFMAGLGVQAAIGRTFTKDEFNLGSPQVALISHSLWQGRFGGDPGIIGRRFEAYVSDRPEEAEVFTIVGVMPTGFWHINPYTQVFAPLRAKTYPYMVRLREGVPPKEAERRITQLVRSGNASLPESWGVQLRSTHTEYVSRVRPILRAIGTASTIVLLIACANVAFLILIRANRRQREVAVRLALGAGVYPIARLLIAETLLLCAAASVIGASGASILLRVLAPSIQQQLGRSAPGGDSAIAIDGTVVLALVVVSFMMSLILALIPTLIVSRQSVLQMMRRGKQAGADSPLARRSRAVFITLEVAGSLALLAGCGLMVRTVTRMLDVDLGINPQRVVSSSIGLRERRYPDAAARLAFHERLLADISRVQGVESAALTNWPLLNPPLPQSVQAVGNPALIPNAGVIAVTSDFFRTVGIELVRGRTFLPSDRIGAASVALISETLAKQLWPNGDSLGQQIRVVGREMPGTDSVPIIRTVVGVVKDTRQFPADSDLADVYIPLLQVPGRFFSVVLKSNSPTVPWPRVLGGALKEIDPEVALGPLRELETVVNDQLSRPRFLATLLAGFSGFALVLALFGSYGVIAYSVKQREHEIAVRIAVGATAGAVTRLFMKEGMIVIGGGIGLGMFGASIVGNMLEAQLYGVQPLDPSTLAVTALAIVFVGAASMWLPARRAATTDPMIALKEE